MFAKRALALVCALMIFLLPVSLAEQDAAYVSNDELRAFVQIPDVIEYKGGVVLRGSVAGTRSAASELKLAYALSSDPYIVLGQTARWQVTISGGSGSYSCSATLCWQDLSRPSSDVMYDVVKTLQVNGSTLSYTFSTPGRYFWQFNVADSSGQILSFQTRPFETYTADAESQPTTVAGKVNYIISTEISANMSDYSRALALHDWLIYHANYDYSYTYYNAEGVLLHGTGVCESYALAYQMLCTAAGVECIVVSGSAGGEPHAWNMVKLDGKWYHVDCTWDDPNAGGYENHSYFCISDATMAKDHVWNRPGDLSNSGSLPPAANEDYSEGASGADHFDFTFATLEEYGTKFDELIDNGCRYSEIIGKYVGSDLNAIYNDFFEYAQSKIDRLYLKELISSSSLAYLGKFFTVHLTWRDQSNLIRIAEESLTLSIGDTHTLYPYEYAPHSNVFTWVSSDPSVVSVASHFDSTTGPYGILTALSDGTATITASVGQSSDSLSVTVLAAHAPEFNLTLNETSNGVTIQWNSVPGATEYQVIRIFEGNETVLTTTSNTSITLNSSQLPGNVMQKVYIVSLRKVGDNVAARYESAPITYGAVTLDFSNTSLPSGLQIIADSAFEGNTSLTAFAIPSNVTTIGARAFAGCTSLKAVYIPASVTSIGQNAFANCPLTYAKVVKNSYAERWLLEAFPDIILVY